MQRNLDLEIIEEAKQIIQEAEANEEEQQNRWYVLTNKKPKGCCSGCCYPAHSIKDCGTWKEVIGKPGWESCLVIDKQAKHKDDNIQLIVKQKKVYEDHLEN